VSRLTVLVLFSLAKRGPPTHSVAVNEPKRKQEKINKITVILTENWLDSPVFFIIPLVFTVKYLHISKQQRYITF
jgi:hypothetical protein